MSLPQTSGMEPQKTTGLLPLAVAAAELGISPRDLRVEIKAGLLPHVRVGERAVFVDVNAIRRVLSARLAALEEGPNAPS